MTITNKPLELCMWNLVWRSYKRLQILYGLLFISQQLKTWTQQWTNSQIIKTEKNRETLNMVAPIPLLRFWKTQIHKVTNICGFARLYIEIEGENEITFV